MRPELLHQMGMAAMLHILAENIEPDIVIGPDSGPEKRDYLRRWYLLRRQEGEGRIYLHRFQRSDNDRALHDHPWPWTTVILEGSYREHTPDGSQLRQAGDVVSREATQLHRVELVTSEVWTLFLTGPKEREWGFQDPNLGWVPWQEYLGLVPRQEYLGVEG